MRRGRWRPHRSHAQASGDGCGGGRARAKLVFAVAGSDVDDTYRDEREDELSRSVERGPRSEAALTVLRGESSGAFFALEDHQTVIGRDPEVGFAIPDDRLSRRHACITRSAGCFFIEDLGSTNGTFVDGKRVRRLQVLEDGCRIFLGSVTVLHFRMHDKVEIDSLRETYALTQRDALTGVFNRRHLQERLWSEAAFARRHGTPLSLMLLDIDHFKAINDAHGHAAGDEALRQLAQSLLALTRKEDVLARYGGEEFALVARGIQREEALALAERVRRSVEQQQLRTEHGTLTFTVSIGIAHSATGTDADGQTLLGAADNALYAAKDAGRNSVSIAPPA
jgi:two-component system, cell cycle response regulator